MGCKRVLLSNDYLPALTRPNVEVVTGEIAEVRPRSVVGSDGVERPVDAIIFGTGFQPTDPPLAHCLRGRDGRTLVEAWAGSPQAHLGTTVAGFPNFFILLGPNTGLGHSSVVYMIEAQIAHMLGALDHMERSGATAIEPRPEAQAAFVADVERRMRGTVWVAGGCRSWYLDGTGRNSTLWPDFSWRFRRRAARLDPAEYATSRPGRARVPVPSATPA
jgi:cation diffusion facilitator CzcD-associated flavoprotein CzcO